MHENGINITRIDEGEGKLQGWGRSRYARQDESEWGILRRRFVSCLLGSSHFGYSVFTATPSNSSRRRSRTPSAIHRSSACPLASARSTWPPVPSPPPAAPGEPWPTPRRTWTALSANLPWRRSRRPRARPPHPRRLGRGRASRSRGQRSPTPRRRRTRHRSWRTSRAGGERERKFRLK